MSPRVAAEPQISLYYYETSPCRRCSMSQPEGGFSVSKSFLFGVSGARGNVHSKVKGRPASGLTISFPACPHDGRGLLGTMCTKMDSYCNVMRTCRSCNCYYCQTQIEKHNLCDTNYQLSLCGKTCPHCRSLSGDTQCN